MRTNRWYGVLGLLGVLAAQNAFAAAPQAGGPPSSQRPGEVERAALGRVGFLTGVWEGEGWSLDASGRRSEFWIKEIYRYRGHGDLMDMEGWFADLLPDRNRAPEQYALGILSFDRASGEYRMWHYSDDGEVFTVKLDVDLETRTAFYTRTSGRGGPIKFTLTVGPDGVWTSKIELLRPDGTWTKVLEFRMKRVGDAD